MRHRPHHDGVARHYQRIHVLYIASAAIQAGHRDDRTVILGRPIDRQLELREILRSFDIVTRLGIDLEREKSKLGSFVEALHRIGGVAGERVGVSSNRVARGTSCSTVADECTRCEGEGEGEWLHQRA